MVVRLFAWKSFPLWKRGLKRFPQYGGDHHSSSFPLRERGLKRIFGLHPLKSIRSFPLWGRGLKLTNGLVRTDRVCRRSPCGNEDLKLLAVNHALMNDCCSPCGCLLLIVDEDPRPPLTVTGKAEEQMIRYEELQKMEG